MSTQSFFDRADAELRRAADRVSAAVKALCPPAFCEHLGNARREFSLALRAIADAALERTEAGIREARERMKPRDRGAETPPSA